MDNPFFWQIGMLMLARLMWLLFTHMRHNDSGTHIGVPVGGFLRLKRMAPKMPRGLP